MDMDKVMVDKTNMDMGIAGRSLVVVKALVT
jgi:hypothetical protein